MKYFQRRIYDKENNDKHIVALMVAHFVYLGNDKRKEVNVFLRCMNQVKSEHIYIVGYFL